MLQRNIHAQFEHTLINGIKTMYAHTAKKDAVIAHRCFYGTSENISDTPIMGVCFQDVMELVERAPSYTTGVTAIRVQTQSQDAIGSFIGMEYYSHLSGFLFIYGQLLEKLYPVFLVAFGQFDPLQSQDLRNDYNGQTFQTAQDWILAVIQRNWSGLIQYGQDAQLREIERIQARKALGRLTVSDNQVAKNQ